MPSKPSTEQQLELGLFGHAKPMVTVAEVAGKFIAAENTVRAWIEERWLMAVPIGAGENAQRQHVRVVRYSADAFYVFRMEETNGVCPPYKLCPEALWWLDQCRQRKKDGHKFS